MSAELPPPPRPDLVEEPAPRPEEKRWVPWSPLEAIPVFLVASVVGGLALVPIFAVSSCAWAQVSALAVGEAAFAATTLIWVTRIHNTPARSLGITPQPLSDAGFGVLGGLGLFVVGWIAGVVVFTVAHLVLGHEPPQPVQIESCVRGVSLLVDGILAVVAAPIGEEILFRGFLYRGLRRRFSVWPAVLISSAAFGLVHAPEGLLLVPSLFPIGIGLALIYERRQSLVASMAAHATFNLIGMLIIAANR